MKELVVPLQEGLPEGVVCYTAKGRAISGAFLTGRLHAVVPAPLSSSFFPGLLPPLHFLASSLHLPTNPALDPI